MSNYQLARPIMASRNLRCPASLANATAGKQPSRAATLACDQRTIRRRLHYGRLLAR